LRPYPAITQGYKEKERLLLMGQPLTSQHFTKLKATQVELKVGTTHKPTVLLVLLIV
jgi:hypothetical protein